MSGIQSSLLEHGSIIESDVVVGEGSIRNTAEAIPKPAINAIATRPTAVLSLLSCLRYFFSLFHSKNCQISYAKSNSK